MLNALHVQFGCLKRTPQVEKLIMCNESNSPVLRNRQISQVEKLIMCNESNSPVLRNRQIHFGLGWISIILHTFPTISLQFLSKCGQMTCEVL